MSRHAELKGSNVGNYIYISRLPNAKIRVFCYTKIREGTAKVRGLAARNFPADLRDALSLRFAAAGYEVFPRRGRRLRAPKA